MFQHLNKHIFNCWPGHFQQGEQISVWLLNPKMLFQICFLTGNSANFLILECHPWLCLTLSIKDAWKAQTQASYWGVKVNLRYDNKSRINLVTFSNLPSTPTAVNQSYFVSARVWQTTGGEIIVIHVWCVGQVHCSIVLTYKKIDSRKITVLERKILNKTRQTQTWEWKQLKFKFSKEKN